MLTLDVFLISAVLPVTGAVFTNVGLRHKNWHNFKTFVSRKFCLNFVFTKGHFGKTFGIEFRS